MIRRAHPAIAVVGIVVLAWIGWTIAVATRADALAAKDPAAALRMEPDNPVALLQAAGGALQAKDFPAAVALGQRLLAAEPGQGEGFATIALAAAERRAPNADALMRLAARRAARNRQVRARVAAAELGRGELEAALVQLDALLRLGTDTNLYPAMIQQSADPAFAKALAATLAGAPRWRASFMGALLSTGGSEAVDRIYAELRRRGALSDAETGRWLGRMMRDGRWGEAYAHWTATLGPLRSGIAPVYDGGFEHEATGIGFDWQIGTQSPGVFTNLEATPGATGNRAAHFRFIGPSADGNLRQPLLLAPGRYRLSLRARAEFLNTDQGLEWQVSCDRGPVIGTVGPIEGSFDWRQLQGKITVPATGCPGQWIELRNPAAPGAAQHASGDFWVDDVAILPIGGATR